MSSEDPPLPYGWVREFDPKTNHPFWVDTNVDPARAIWTHPYDDEQYLREHPEVREKVESRAGQQQDSMYSPPSIPRRHSFHGHDSTSIAPENYEVNSNFPREGQQERGFFGKLKDRAIGTTDEREAYRREQHRLEMERQRQYTEMRDAERARYAREQAIYDEQYLARRRYGPPPGDPFMYGPRYGRGYGYGYGYDEYDDYDYDCDGGRRRRHCRGRRGIGMGRGRGRGGGLLGALVGDIL